jgi:hypothetical protein
MLPKELLKEVGKLFPSGVKLNGKQSLAVGSGAVVVIAVEEKNPKSIRNCGIIPELLSI